ncbi:MAG TPA: single-stranded DNA-binding protein [Flammeovirgaceae bacterium]|nr:single-stranded DNA-binding protein [Flammeovirgaceae bacterium]
MRNLRNRVQLIGNIGKEPVVKTFESGKTKATFSLATTEQYYDQNGKKVQDTQWHNLVAWGKTASFVENYLERGSRIAVEGKLTHRSYEDEQGNTRYITEVVVGEIMMLTSKQASA